MKGADVLVQMLLEYKVKAIFGVPGDTSPPLYEAIYDASPRVRNIMARDERSATEGSPWIEGILINSRRMVSEEFSSSLILHRRMGGYHESNRCGSRLGGLRRGPLS